MESVAQKFLRYIAVDSMSIRGSDKVPSTPGQLELAKLLESELLEMGIKEVHVDEYANLYASIPATQGLEQLPAIGFIAHLDTATDIIGCGENARVVKNHGGDIPLDADGKYRLSPEVYPHMNDYIGEDLIVTDGHGLLGADDKAGMAEIMAMAQRLVLGNTPHCSVKLGFSPDEEVGGGIETFDIERFGTLFAYTVDGGKLGEIEYENFNAADAEVTVNGSLIHTGEAKGRLVNSIQIAMELHAMLPVGEDPALTEGYEGFNHLHQLSGTIENTSMHYLVRNHDFKKFETQKALFLSIVDFLNTKYGEDTVSVKLSDSYFNMKEKILPHMHLVENARKAMESCGVKPLIIPIRGGTDGAKLSYRGLPCPNLSTGGHNAHGRFEYIPVSSLEKMAECLEALVKQYSSL